MNNPIEIIMDLLDADDSDDVVDKLQSLRRSSSELAREIDRHLLGQIRRHQRALQEVQEKQRELKKLIEKLTSPPWHRATVLGREGSGEQARALVVCHGRQTLVPWTAEIDSDQLVSGQTVYLTPEANCIVGLAVEMYATETGTFEREIDEHRIMVRCRDEEVILFRATKLKDIALSKGDLLVCDRQGMLAFAKLPQTSGEEYFVAEQPEVRFEDIGGLDEVITSLKRHVTGYWQHPELLRRYHQQQGKNILLVGPPGNGKTMLAKALANFMGELMNNTQPRFISIKPGQLKSKWFGETEQRIRELFNAVRQAGQDSNIPVVVFFDELDSIGTLRGGSYQSVTDRIQTSFYAELDGFEALQNVMLIGATNRRDLLDPALIRPKRFGDYVVNIPRPGRQACYEIFAKHLPADVPCDQQVFGSSQEARAAMIDLALAYIFAPNSREPLARIKFRNGEIRPVIPADLVSGALIARVCQQALHTACYRELESNGNISGYRREDLMTALEDTFRSHVEAFKPYNVRHYIADLPEDQDIVSVEVVKPKLSRTFRYLKII